MTTAPRVVPVHEEDVVELQVLPLRRGSSGAPVHDLQARLTALGYVAITDAEGEFGPATEAALREFQKTRGLRADGVCARATWLELVEAGYRIGDRLLYRRTPMLRGDDVADLQCRLSSFGFYAGAIDGIFGDRTASALREFQRNAGLPVDSVLGPSTLAELSRLRSRGGDLVSSVREELQRASLSLRGARVAVGEEGGFDAGSVALIRALSAAGAISFALHHPDGSKLAAQANAAQANVYVGLSLLPESQACRTLYYRGFRYESLVSRSLAELLQPQLVGVLGLGDDGIEGMALPVLRETRMPAVVIELGNPAMVVQHTADLAGVVVSALTKWLSASSDS